MVRNSKGNVGFMLALLVVATHACSSGTEKASCGIPDEEHPEFILTPKPSFMAEEIPSSFTWTDVKGKSFVTTAYSQFIPVWCGSCWAMAATSALSDRLKIAREAKFPEIVLSPQELLSCDTYSFGCSGGSSLYSYVYIKQRGITDTTCSPFRARGWTNGFECQDAAVCWTCDEQANCHMPVKYNKWTVTEYGTVYGEQDMKAEILARGPISCGMNSHVDGFDEYRGGVFHSNSTDTYPHHYMEVVGWGEEQGIPYWHIKNSFGTHWGIDGYVKLIRGINNLGLETNGCAWAVPNPEPIVVDNSNRQSGMPFTDTHLPVRRGLESLKHIEEPSESFVKKTVFPEGERVLSPLPASSSSSSPSLQKSFHWGDINGENYLSWVKNQYLPHYCENGWAHASASALSDRFNIANENKHPQVTLNAQTLLNCGLQKGSCALGNPGNPGGVYYYMQTQGLTDMTCQGEIASQPPSLNCDAISQCVTCVSPSPWTYSDGQENCTAVTDNKLYYVEEYGSYSGDVDEIKHEIAARGPVVCGMQITDGFRAYTGGIYSEKLDQVFVINHFVSIVGWGQEEEQEYWVVRNSFGMTWGEQGFFRINMHQDNLGITADCSWAVPSMTKPKQ